MGDEVRRSDGGGKAGSEFTLITSENKGTLRDPPPHASVEPDGPTLVAKAAAKRAELLAEAAAPSVPAAQATAVQVVCRARPLLESERERIGERIEGATAASHAQYDYEAVVCRGREVFCLHEERSIGVPTGNVAAAQYELHGAFGGECSTGEIYAQCVEPLVHLALRGGLATVIACGQTGSGKTYTMAALQALAAAQLLEQGGNATLWVSFLENRGDKCFDLLDDSAPVALRDDGSGLVHAAGLSCVRARTAAEFARRLAEANGRRRTAATASNEQSSRSHAICTLRLGGPEGVVDGNGEGAPLGGRVQLVDLAGSERREDAVAHDAARLAEMREINASLGTLKECIRALLRRATTEPSAHVPYRDAKLTMLLRGAFEGARGAPEEARDDGATAADGGSDGSARSAVCLIAHVAPLRSQAKHTANTLDYAAQMLLATMAERQRAQFDEVEKWSGKKLVAWVAQLDGGAYAHCAHAFARSSGKALTVEYLPDVAQWVLAAGGTEEDAARIYNTFRELHKKAKAAKRRQQPQGAGQPPSSRPTASQPM